MLLGVLGTNELIIILIGGALVIGVLIFIYKYGKNKGRLQEMDRQLKEKNKELR